MILLAGSGVPVAAAGAVTLGLLVGAPLIVFGSDTLRTRPAAAGWAIGLAVVGFALSLGVAGLDRELCRLLVDVPAARRWARRPWTWRRLLRLPVDEASWRRLLWLLLRVGIGTGTALVGYFAVEAVVDLAAAPLRDRGGRGLAGPPAALLVAVVALAAARGVGWLLHQLAVELLGPSARERIAELEERAVELDTRARLARELHDSVGHTVTVVVLQAAAARQALTTDPRYAAQALEVIEDAGRRAVGELADALRVLRGGDPDEIAPPGLDRLPALLEVTRAAGLPVSLACAGDLAAVPEPVGRVAYRVVQEACTNVLRHAGAVGTRVHLSADGRQLVVGVHNESGAPTGHPAGAGQGLRGLRQRVEQLGGVLVAGPVEGHGFQVRAVVPIGAGTA
jgi:signal transduction histidine kinase